MPLKPIFQARLIPRDLHASIRYIDVLVDDHRIKSKESCMDFLEKQFPMYEVQTIFEGFKQGD